jgi:hypothetical protein
MTAIFVIVMILVCVVSDMIVHRQHKHKKQLIFYHDPNYIPTPTMADGGKKINMK